MECNNLSLEKQFWDKLQQALDILDPTNPNPTHYLFSTWYKDYGNIFHKKLQEKIPLIVYTVEGQQLLKQAIYTIEVGLDGYNNHGDIEYLSDLTALAIEHLYRELISHKEG